MADDVIQAGYRPLTPQELAAQQAGIDRQRKIAEFLQQQSFQSPEGQMVSGHYVAPSMLQNLSRLAQGLIGKSQQEALDAKQANIVKQQGDNLFKAFGGQIPQNPSLLSQSQNAAPPVAQINPDQPLPDGQVQTQSIPAPDNISRIAAALTEQKSEQPQTSSQKPSGGYMDVPGMTPEQKFAMYSNDPKGYMTLFGKQFEPTELQRNSKWMGIKPEEQAAATRAENMKKGMYEMQPGATSINLSTGEKTFNPKVGEGINIVNGIASEVPNYSNVNAGIEGAKTRANESNKILPEVKMASGEKIPMFAGDAVKINSQNQSSVNGEQFKGESLLNQLPQNVRAGVLKDAISGDGKFKLNYQMPNGMRITGDVDLNSGSLQSSQNVNQSSKIGQSTAAEQEQQGIGKNLADYQKDINEKADNAQILKSRIAEMREASQNFTSGTLTPYKEKLGGIMLGLGVSPESVNSKLGNVSDMQSFNKEALSLAFDMTKNLTSRPAASEVMLALKANPNLALQPDASKKIMDVMEGMANFNLAKQQASFEWRKLHNNSLDGFETYWNKNESIKNYVDLTKLISPIPQGGTQKTLQSSDIYDEFKLKRPK